MRTEPYPLRLEPRLSYRLWGGGRLAPLLGVPAHSEGEPLAEAWLVYAGNPVTNGPLRGRNLGELAAELGAPLLGTASVARHGAAFPLVAKLIDAAQALSIQVHPDDRQAALLEGPGRVGKDETWYLLDAAPGARLVRGFRRAVSAGEVRDAVASGRLERLLASVPAHAGQVVHNPPGVVHAIGAGISLFEIQQPSDLTYRLFDYGRRDAAGAPRELHLDRALAVAQLGPAPPTPAPRAGTGPGRRELFAGAHYLMEALDPARVGELETDPATVELLTVTSGGATLEWAGGELALPAGAAAVLPAALGRYALSGRGETLRCRLP